MNTGEPWLDLLPEREEAEWRVLRMQRRLHRWAVADPAVASMTSPTLSMTRRTWSWHGTGCGATRAHEPPVSTGLLPAVSVGRLRT